MNKQLFKVIEEVLATKTALRRVEHNLHIGYICVDFRERLENQVLRQIFTKSDPKRVLESMLSTWYANCEKTFKDEILSIIEQHFHDKGMALEYHGNENDISEWIDTHIKIEYLNGRFMTQNMTTDILLTADSIITEDLLPNGTIGSVILLVEMPVSKYFDLMGFARESNYQDKYFAVRAGTNCALFTDDDKVTVAKLEKDYKLYMHNIDKVTLDCCMEPDALKDSYKLPANLWGNPIV